MARFFDVPLEVWLSDEYHASLATILKRSRPKAGIDLTQHVLLSSDPALRLAFGWGTPMPPARSSARLPPAPIATRQLRAHLCRRQGNWAQMMNTYQSGGIPGNGGRWRADARQ